jgi:tRNA (guanosine-2'-O-)-methyltransferase
MELLNYLQSFLTENRKTKFEEVLSYRTKHLTVVLENIIDNHNSSAVIRSAECFGIQDIHQIDFGSKLKPAKNISRGSYNWMDIHIHKASENNSIDCIQKLKSEGYRIIATTPHIKKQSVSELDLTQKVAIFFGQEHDGLSKQVIDSADEFLIAVPMPSTDFVFSEGPPSKYPIKNAANMNIIEAINAPVPNTARKSL